LTLMSLIVGNSFKFTTLVRISADTIRMVYEMRPCADILSGDPSDGIRWTLADEHYRDPVPDRKLRIPNASPHQLHHLYEFSWWLLSPNQK
jgi:hypothetical protein